MNPFPSLFQKPNPTLPALTGPAVHFSNLAVPGQLRISADPARTGFDFQPAPDQFPRRVQEGEVIAAADDLPLLAPLPGILDYLPDERVFQLKTEGQIQLGRSSDAGQSMPIDELEALADGETLPALLDAMSRGGLPSLEFRGRALHRLLARALEHKSPVIVLARVAPDNAVNWPALLQPRSQQLSRLTALLQRCASERNRRRPRSQPEQSQAQAGRCLGS